MSTDIRSNARIEHSTMPTTTTTIVTGRRSAMLISHMTRLLSALKEWLQISLEPGGNEQRPPDIQTSDAKVDFRLRQ